MPASRVPSAERTEFSTTLTHTASASDNVSNVKGPPKTSNSIEFLTYCQNFNRMKSSQKIDQIYKNVNSCLFSVILGTETSWDKSVKNEEVFGNRFTVFRDDRDPHLSNKKSGGGVLVALDSCIDAEVIESEKFNDFEHVWVKASIAGETHVFASVYFPPLHSNKQNFEKFFNNVKTILANIEPSTKIHLYGDFNQRTMDFIVDDENELILLPVIGENATLQYFFDEMAQLGLNQINHVKNQQNCYLDLLFTNCIDDFCVFASEHPLWKNEAFHSAIEYSFHVHKKSASSHDWEYEEIFKYSEANVPAIKCRLDQTDWQTLLDCEIDEAATRFYNVIENIFNEYIPRTKRRTKRDTNPPWFTRELKHLRNLKQKAHKAKNKFQNNTQSDITREQLENEYADLCEQFNFAISAAQETYNRKIERDLKTNPKNFFSYVKHKSKSDNFPSSMFLEDKIGNNSSEKCNLFAEFFESVYTTFNENDRDYAYFSHLVDSQLEISIRKITEQEVKSALKGVNSNKGPGPDGIPPVMVKTLAEELAKPLFLLFNHSLTSGKFPEEWKRSFLVPIFKTGKKSDIKNYRGIAIISCIPKLFESIVNQKMFNQVRNIISESQHGFFKGRSTASNLLHFVSYTLNAMDHGNIVHTLYTDFSKAFDRVDIPMLLFKLKKAGIDSSLLRWLESYLTGRIQIVKFEGSLSKPINVISGVPQGSHLGPLLFILFINDIYALLKQLKVLTYADDMKLFMEVQSPSDVVVFQNEVDIFYEWCSKSLLKLNIKKCNTISYTRKHSVLNICIKLDNQSVAKCDRMRDLGVILDSKMTFVEHYNAITHKAKNMLSFIKRFTYNFNDPYTLKTLYISYVRSLLEYCSVVWSPHLVTYEDRIESVQKQFVLFALRKLGWSTFPLPSYESRCMLINLDTLKKRREFAALAFVNDITSNRINCSYLLQSLNFYVPGRILRTRSIFAENPCRTNYAKNSPINRIMSIYNRNCEVIDLTMSKSALRKSFFNRRNLILM